MLVQYFRYICLTVTAIAVSSCGGSSEQRVTGPAGTFDGNMPGPQPVFVPQDAIFRTGIPDTWPPGAILFITDYPFACADEASSYRVTQSHALEIELPNSIETISPGVYQIVTQFLTSQLNGTDPIAMVNYDGFDAECSIIENVDTTALRGSLTIDSSSDHQITGHFSVRFQDDVALSGQFSAGSCPSLQAKNSWGPGAFLPCGAAVSCSPSEVDGGNTQALPPGCP